ncbi:Regulator of telomere elongation helicase 1, partial [Nowakowskiella sp. JEL0078]
MPEYEIRGITVRFPYVAYEPQLKFMETVIASLQDSQNSMVESPTGTGKTLCLLCAVLAWRECLIARKQMYGLIRNTPNSIGKSTFQNNLLKKLDSAVTNNTNE